MRISRLYQPGSITVGQSLLLDEASGNHLARVLRVRVGAEVILFNGEGGEYSATVAAMDRKGVQVEVRAFREEEVESPLRITLLQGISRGERMDYTIQKAVELGVDTIVPVATARSVVNVEGERAERKVGHWQRIAIAACEQCGRNRIPSFLPIRDYRSALAESSSELKLLLDHQEASQISALAPARTITLLVGPEGGLDATEKRAAREAGFAGLRLGPRVLRTETAALVAISLLQGRFGDLG